MGVHGTFLGVVCVSIESTQEHTVCCATNHSQESAISPHVLFVRAKMAEEEVAALVVDNGGGMSRAGFCR